MLLTEQNVSVVEQNQQGEMLFVERDAFGDFILAKHNVKDFTPEQYAILCDVFTVVKVSR